MVYGYLPLMVLPIYVSLEKLDLRLLEASADLGATPWRTFLQVTLPLSLPGVATGSMLVFILLMGEFIIPALLGGGKVFFIGNALVDLFLQSRNWPFGAAVSVALVVDHAGDRRRLHALRARPRRRAPRGAGLRRRCASTPSLIYLFLYLPIALIVVYSFNAGRYAMDWQGFSTEWYAKAFANPLRHEGAVDERRRWRCGRRCSPRIIGTLAALGLERMHGALRKIFDGLIYVAIMVPGVVIGIATLIAFVTVFDMRQPGAGGPSRRGGAALRDGRADDRRRACALQSRRRHPDRALAARRHGPQPDRGVGGSLRDAVRAPSAR